MEDFPHDYIGTWVQDDEAGLTLTPPPSSRVSETQGTPNGPRVLRTPENAAAAGPDPAHLASFCTT